jgi:hypothetical protein
MALAATLAAAGHPPAKIHTAAKVHFGPVPGGFVITRRTRRRHTIYLHQLDLIARYGRLGQHLRDGGECVPETKRRGNQKRAKAEANALFTRVGGPGLHRRFV